MTVYHTIYYDNVYWKICNSIIQYNVQKNYFRCINYKCSTKIHGFSFLIFNYHKENFRKLLLIYANFCNDISIFCSSKNLPISKYEISQQQNIGEEFMDKKLKMDYRIIWMSSVIGIIMKSFLIIFGRIYIDKVY